jgi:hypothetical protein
MQGESATEDSYNIHTHLTAYARGEWGLQPVTVAKVLPMHAGRERARESGGECFHVIREGGEERQTDRQKDRKRGGRAFAGRERGGDVGRECQGICFWVKCVLRAQ